MKEKLKGRLHGMKKRISAYHEVSNNNKTFRQYLSVSLAISTVLLTVFLVFYISNLNVSAKRSKMTLADSCLSFVVNDMDFMFSAFIEQSLDELYDSNSFIAVSYAGTKLNLNSNIVTTTKSNLYDLTTRFPFISTVILEIPHSDLVITSSLGAYHTSISPYAELAGFYHAGPEDLMPVGSTIGDLSSFQYNGDYYFARDYFVINGEPQSTLFLKLDRTALYDYLINSLQGEMALYIFDGIGRPVLDGVVEYPDAILETAAQENTEGESGILCKTSAILQWRYYLVFDAQSSLGLVQTLPLVFLLVVLSLGVSLIAARYLYRPFHKLLSNVRRMDVDNDTEGSISDNSFEYLDQTIQSIVGRQDKLSSMMQFISTDVLSYTFSRLVNGENIGYDEIVGIFKGIETPFMVNALYSATAVRFSANAGAQGTADPKALLTGVLTAFCQRNDAVFHIVMTDETMYALILQFNKSGVSILAVKHLLHELRQELRESLTKGGYHAAVRSGNLYHSVLDVGFSYREAVNALGEELGKEVWEDPRPEEEELSEETLTSVLPRRSQQIVAEITEGNDQAATEIAVRTVNDIQRLQSTVDKQAESIKLLINSIVEIIATFDYINFSVITDEYSIFEENIKAVADTVELKDVADKSLANLIRSFSVQIQRQHNPYILGAQEYVRIHYADPDLSLKAVADTVGISPSYLSKLFSDALGTGLIDYTNRYRLGAATKQLTETDQLISEIASDCGFSSSRSFIRVFRKYYDMTPSDYRQTHSNQPKKEET